MKLINSILIMISVLLIYSCKKNDITHNINHTYGINSNQNSFFEIREKVNQNVLLILDEIKSRNNKKEFITNFVENHGFPIWSKAFISITPKDTVIYIPLVLKKTRYINGFIKAVIDNGISISNFKASDYKFFSSNANFPFSPDNFVTLMLYFENKVFKNDRFILTDPNLYNNLSKNLNQFNNREIKLKNINLGSASTTLDNIEKLNTATTFSECELLTISIDWLEKDESNCTCANKICIDWQDGCTDCSNIYTTSFTYTSCGGGQSGIPTSSNGSWNPYPPPGGGGSNISINVPTGGYLLFPNTQQYLYFLDYSLSANERLFWDDPYKSGFISPLIQKLVEENYDISTITFIHNWLGYLMTNPDITPEEFQNYFLNEVEGSDGEYDIAFWENPNLTFQVESLPSMASFKAAFPKIVDPQTNSIYQMKAKDVYDLVGGIMKKNHDDQIVGWNNACAIRGSRALNYCGKPIISNLSKVYLGNDGKKYIVSAKAFNQYMRKKFGPATYILTASEINNNPNEIIKFLRGKTGIYTMVTSGGPYSGHVDLIENGKVLSGAATNPINNVSYIEIWELK